MYFASYTVCRSRNKFGVILHCARGDDVLGVNRDFLRVLAVAQYHSKLPHIGQTTGPTRPALLPPPRRL